jgi:hypothetical protein
VGAEFWMSLGDATDRIADAGGNGFAGTFGGEECVAFERDSFGALHQMLAGLPAPERDAAWEEIHRALAEFEGADGFVGPCEMLVISATR